MYSIYIVKEDNPESSKYKIGVTKKNPLLRLKQLNIGNPQKLILVEVFKTRHGYKLEKSLHRHYQHNACDVNEWFSLPDFCVKEFLSYCEKENNLFNYMSQENYFWN